MTDESLLQTLGELHVQSEDAYEQLNGVTESKNPERHAQLAQQIEIIEEQLAGAREVWTDRKHVKQPAAEWSREVSGLEAQLTTASAEFDNLPLASPQYTAARQSLARLKEQAHIARAAERFVK